MTPIDQAAMVIPCPRINPAVNYFTEELGFAVESIYPADDPRVAIICGHGLRLRLDAEAEGDPGQLLLTVPPGSAQPPSSVAPNGTRIEWQCRSDRVLMFSGPGHFEVTRFGKDDPWTSGRAGMRYRDLVPSRQHGRLIASHIHIADGGPVADYVHYHLIGFQLIYCWKGWVRVVYEDQGEPFVLDAGDCVLQPPLIRHRVLESSPELNVIEVGCPAEHETRSDRELQLPNSSVDPDRVFSGQRFVRFRAAGAPWLDGPEAGLQALDTGIGQATGNLAQVHVVRCESHSTVAMSAHDDQLWLVVVLDGAVDLTCQQEAQQTLDNGDACVIPPGRVWSLKTGASPLTLLCVRLASPQQEIPS